jgi:SanA protein
VYEDGRPSDALTDRLATALDLYNTQLVRHILVTGDNSPASDHETDIMRAWLIERGVPPDAIWTDPSGVRTLDSMARAAEVFQIQDAIICTQRFHLPRSLFLAAAYDIRALGLVSDRHTYVKALQFWTREQLARALSVLDVHILHTRPAHDLSTEGVISPRHIPAPTE